MERLTRAFALGFLGAVSIVVLGCSASEGGDTQSGVKDVAAELSKNSQPAPPQTEYQKKIMAAAMGAGHGGGPAPQTMGSKRGTESPSSAAKNASKPEESAKN